MASLLVNILTLQANAEFEEEQNISAINAQPLEKVKLATLPDSYSSAQS